MSSSMTSNGEFDNFDDKAVYMASLEKATHPDAHNFVVQFGKDEAQVAFDLNLENFEVLLKSPVPPERPVRWINIWAPDHQPDIIKLLGKRYEFSPRLLAIMNTLPPVAKEPPVRISRLRGRRISAKFEDVELAEVPETEDQRGRSENGLIQSEISHYTLAEQMINYQSIDFGTRYLCIGANWMHGLPKSEVSSETETFTESDRRRLWSWLVLCDDNTVISLHEDTQSSDDDPNIKSMRANTISVLSQLSTLSHGSVDPILMQTVRQALKLHKVPDFTQGVEGASLLFYHLFDDWRAVFLSIGMYQKRLGDLRKMIFDDATKSSMKTPRSQIIPRLHVLGSQLRQSQDLYQGYKNLIERALKAVEVPKLVEVYHPETPRTMSTSGHTHSNKGVTLAKSAAQRFERLSDRLELLVLSKTKEFLDEKDALISTYFNINAQKDSEATARLTRAATLLAKLSVLFLPVSLMTSYFSIQISELTGVYTAKDYWSSFAVIISISFLCLFFFSRLLMWITEQLDAKIIATSRFFRNKLGKKSQRQRR